MNAIRRHPLGGFYGITFLVSWGYWVTDALAGGRWSHAPGLVGPMVAAIVVTAITKGVAGTQDLASRMLRWRVRPGWYLWVLAPVGVAVGMTALVATDRGRFPPPGEWSEMSGFVSIPGWATLAVILVINGLGEETGWRGFALPAFRLGQSEITASLLVAIPWAAWHAPTFFIDSAYRDFPVLLLPGWLLGFFALSVVMTWVYEGARSSILLALLHASLNVATATRATDGAVAGVVSMAVIAWSLVIVRCWRKKRMRSAASAMQLDGAYAVEGGETR